MSHEQVVILDNGSQYTQLIARRTRELGVFSEIVSHRITAQELAAKKPIGVILSGGPASVYVAGAPEIDHGVFRLGVPVLGICYGLQYAAKALGGDVRGGEAREFGHASLLVDHPGELLHGLGGSTNVWMSHGDKVARLDPQEWDRLAHTANCEYAAVRHRKLPFYGVQFHPEVHHTADGRQVLHNFLFGICKARGDWRMSSFISEQVESIRRQVGKGRVICGLSGGVDSTVVAALIAKAVGNQLTCIMVDNGLLRTNESELVREAFEGHFEAKLVVAQATDRFLDHLAGITDPDEKRKRIGHDFIRVFEEEARKVQGAAFLAQGTLYPDVIESVAAHGGPTAHIKRHHNVGGLPEDMEFELVEPLRSLFKDEVREIGKELGLPDALVWRQPFPGPGLAVRCVGEVTRERLAVLRRADDIVRDEIDRAGLTRSIWQSFAVLLPTRSIGVMGDEKTYEETCVVRAVESVDGMTADWVQLPYDVLRTISTRIINEVRGINRVAYDISSKPPATIEWE
jgi:GMP synthase (glutamine-hydrolysing)